MQRKYFKLVRQLIEEKVPPLYDVVLSPPNSISETLLQMIQHPLRLMSPINEISSADAIAQDPSTNSQQQQPTPLISAECVKLILSSFIEAILVPEYTKPIQLFIIPCLAKNADFPFIHLLQYLSDLIMQNYAEESIAIAAQQAHEYTISGQLNLAARNNFVAGDEIFQSSYSFHSFLTFGQLNLDRINENTVWISNYINVLGK